MTSAATLRNPVPDPDYEFIRALVLRCSAIVLEPSKDYLIEARLGPLARQEGLGSIGALAAKLRQQGDGPLQRKVVDAMTTNETLFFRDQNPFDVLRQNVLPELIAKRADRRRLRIWSAACSSGQEPYTIAMLLCESFAQLASWTIEIVATDLSPSMIEKASRGVYGKIEVNRGLPAALLAKYFTQSGTDYALRDDVRRMVTFREMNLASSWPPLGTFDVVFLRNVLIYFDVPTKKSILSRVLGVLEPDGYLFLGAAETTMNLEPRFARMPLERSGCYRVDA